MVVSNRGHFDQELKRLRKNVTRLGSLAQSAVAAAVRALVTADVATARRLPAEDATINQLRLDIEADCYALLATEQPVAGDLRAIVSALSIAAELERIGDHAKKIAKTYARQFGEQPVAIPLGDIPRLGELATEMLGRALGAYVAADVAEAQAVCVADDQADALYKQTFNVILSLMLENPEKIGSGMFLLQVAHELERVADRATNISERVIYAVKGELADLNV